MEPIPYEPQTEFEKPRGISHVETRGGFAQVHVSELDEPLGQSRLRVLRGVAGAGVSIDFLKLTQSGLSFLIPELLKRDTEEALTDLGFPFTVRTGTQVVMVHAVNMRDEEGLIARILSSAIASGAPIEHLSDMHDRVLIVTDETGAGKLVSRFNEEIQGAAHAN